MAGGSCSFPGHQEIQKVITGTGYLYLLNGGGRIDRLGADFRAGADETALPDTRVTGDHVFPHGTTSIARIEVVSMRERQRRRTNEGVIERVLRAGGITKQAVFTNLNRSYTKMRLAMESDGLTFASSGDILYKIVKDIMS